MVCTLDTRRNYRHRLGLADRRVVDRMNSPDYRQQQENLEEQQWKEMQQDLEIWRNFAQDFEQFVAAHEKENGNGQTRN